MRKRIPKSNLHIQALNVLRFEANTLVHRGRRLWAGRQKNRVSIPGRVGVFSPELVKIHTKAVQDVKPLFQSSVQQKIFITTAPLHD
jgi:hypothetical protein